MDETTVTAGTNSLSYLIPTGERDIAVRELLIPIFGDAISCKVPGAACGTQGLGDAGAVASTVFGTFNGGTLVFVTILLIFIGLLGFIKTAQDGEFLGKTWNTTFTALRMLVGIAFILPMPNSYSTVQNFTMYVGLWSSGLANEANKAVSDHYLRRLQNSMINQDPEATTTRGEAQSALAMHACASLINKLYPGQADLRYEQTNLGSANRIEYAYIERGNYLRTGSAPCGRMVVKPYGTIKAEGNVPTDGVWNSALGAAPLTADARKQMAAAATALAEEARQAKITAVTSLMSPNSSLRRLADEMVDRYAAGLVEYDANTGSVAKAPEESEGGRFTEFQSKDYLNRYANIIRSTDSKLNEDITKARNTMMDTARQEGETSFLGQAKAMLQNGGWMSAAATYRTMLDMVSIQFVGDKQTPFKLEGRDEIEGFAVSSSGGVAIHVATLNTLIERLLDSDTGKEIIASNLGAAGALSANQTTLNKESLTKVATGKLSSNEALEIFYGNGWLNGMRNSIMKTMTISSDYDPLYQMKTIGDMVTVTAESLIAAEFVARTYLAVAKVAVTAASKNIAGRIATIVTSAGDTSLAAIEGVDYIAQQLFVIMKVLTGAMVMIGYMFSTWLPALPFIAFLLAQMGWLFGLIMTLFAMNIWAVMHTTPARNDSFIGSEAQGYLLLVSLFFRPVIAVSALSLSYIIAPPVIKLVNMTLLPMMYASNVSTNTLSVITATLFGLVLYFVVVKAVLIMVYMIPQSFPDEVMRIISAGIGDLGQSRALSTMETSDGTARAGLSTLQGVDRASGEGFKAKIADERKKAEDKKREDNMRSAVAEAFQNTNVKTDEINGSAPLFKR